MYNHYNFLYSWRIADDAAQRVLPATARALHSLQRIVPNVSKRMMQYLSRKRGVYVFRFYNP
jgi:hypothetical protein